MHSIRRSCQLAVQSSHRVHIYANGPRRTFSLSSARSRGALPNFLPPSSPELSELLAAFNSKVLLPSHLTKEQQKLVFSQESRAKLEAEPVEITLGDVTLPLQHLNRNRLPDRFKTLKGITKQAVSPEDWENVLRCLEGFKEAGIKIKHEWKENVVRNMNMAGMQHFVLKGLKRAKATDLCMKKWAILREVIRGVHDKAARADWEKEETAKALKLAKQLVELLENKEHCGDEDLPKAQDFRGDPVVIALPTEMAAVMAERYGGDKEEVRTMQNRLVAAMEQVLYMELVKDTSPTADHVPTKFLTDSHQLDFIHAYLPRLLELIIVWNALKTSRKVLGNNTPITETARNYEEKIEDTVARGIKALEHLMVSQKSGKRFTLEIAEYTIDAVKRCT